MTSLCGEDPVSISYIMLGKNQKEVYSRTFLGRVTQGTALLWYSLAICFQAHEEVGQDGGHLLLFLSKIVVTNYECARNPWNE
jgi:hypothetical protein